jgi:hypothetical protein
VGRNPGFSLYEILKFPCTKIPSDDADKSCRKKFLMTWKRFQSGIPYQDRRISYLGEYCGIDAIRSSGLHSFNE